MFDQAIGTRLAERRREEVAERGICGLIRRSRGTLARAENPVRDVITPLCRSARAILEEVLEWVEFGRGWPCRGQDI